MEVPEVLLIARARLNKHQRRNNGGKEKIESAVEEVSWWSREYELEMTGREELKIRNDCEICKRFFMLGERDWSMYDLMHNTFILLDILYEELIDLDPSCAEA
jgi:hypothetical protein